MLMADAAPETRMPRLMMLLLPVCLALGGCQPPTYDILAVLKGAQLVFEVRGSGSWPFRDEDGISAEWLQVRDRNEIIWAIELDPDRPDCRADGETPPFPLVFGRTPKCYLEKVPAKRPREGALHRIDGEGFRSGSGFFRLHGGAANLKWTEVEKELRDWPDLTDPRFPPGPGNGPPYEAEEPANGSQDPSSTSRE